MADLKKRIKPPALRLLHWTELVRPKEGNDPLGLALRVGARLAGQLLYCITSITPRARYYSFLPWCVREYREKERGLDNDLGLLEAVRRREKALVLGCVLHHDGMPCEGGGLIGSNRVKNWHAEGIPSRPDYVNRLFSKNPALGQYLGSLINLRVFKPTLEELNDDGFDELDEADEEGRVVTIDNLELDKLGESLASYYDTCVAPLSLSNQLAKPKAILNRDELTAWGRSGGFCELREIQANDREALCELFFDSLGSDYLPEHRSEAHAFRASSLLLLLEMAKQFSNGDIKEHGFLIVAESFHEATYFDCIFFWAEADLNEEAVILPVLWPPKLRDVMMRWRMFHFHQITRFALEALLGVIVAKVRDAELSGLPINELVRRMALPGVGRPMNTRLGLLKEVHLWSMPVREIWKRAGFDDDATTVEGSKAFDATIGPAHRLSESRLEFAWRDHVNAETGGIAAILMLLSSLARFRQWEDSDWGCWLSKATRDDYLDVSPLVISKRLAERFGSWPDTTLGDVTEFVLRRFVIDQHEAMAYTKSDDGSRAFFWNDGARLHSRGSGTWDVNVGNARLGSAVSILTDLGCLEKQESGCHVPTFDGLKWLEKGLSERPLP